jgi:hypothetical protein
MATPAQISRLAARIEQLASRVHPGIEGCVICIPDSWLDTPLEAQTWARHCQRYPDDATAKIVVLVRFFTRGPVSSPVEPGEPLAVNSMGWRECDGVSWQEIAYEQGWAP